MPDIQSNKYQTCVCMCFCCCKSLHVLIFCINSPAHNWLHQEKPHRQTHCECTAQLMKCSGQHAAVHTEQGGEKLPPLSCTCSMGTKLTQRLWMNRKPAFSGDIISQCVRANMHNTDSLHCLWPLAALTPSVHVNEMGI